jgi:ribosome-binding factor A
MSSRRLLKAAAAVRQVLSMAILTELRDPRVSDVTVTHVEMAPDMREAKVFVSVMGDDTRQNLCLHGLQSARGFLQAKIAEGIETRYTPRLRFVLDQGVKRSLEVARILREVLPGEVQSEQGPPVTAPAGAASPEAADAVPDDAVPRDAPKADDPEAAAFDDGDPPSAADMA